MTSPTAPIITATGISAPTFAQILAYLQSQYLAIFGADTDIDPDTQDGQLLGVFAQAISDANSAAIAIYNSFSPGTAVGAGLSSNVQINGLTRLVPSASVALLTISGVPNTLLPNNSSVKDQAGNIWVLAPSSSIGPTGIAGALATCQTLGAIGAGLPANAFTINTPTFGWTGVVNNGITIGAPVESDAALRFRQAQSVSLPSQTIFEGIVASIAQVPGVKRVKGYENNTSSGAGLPGGAVLPANNLLFVVEGGNAAAVAQAIFSKITPGIPTWNSGGTNNVSQTVTDANGSTRLINFQTAIENFVSITVGINPLAGWSPATETLISNALTAYLASLPIGSVISYFSLVNVISLPGTPQFGTFTIGGLTLGGQQIDAQLVYNYAPQLGAFQVTVL